MAQLAPRWLADKSALARMPHPEGERSLRPLLVEGLVATCRIVDFEVGYSAQSASDHEAIRRERRILPLAPVDDGVLDRAFDVQGLLAERSEHRLPIPDLIIAAAAESAELTVLHYDTDYELIAAVTGQPHEWIVPRGSL